ncbi:MAG: undecaprenyldiphospho-muramoylpentapeptide beta-N-acetylglucosaminyltransferase [Ignavibacteriae bacterium]|nr:undecaprenyldiphospho-muramoylpentapeptide beta-N-acetylglucosaminyltransferase [Ignavibacteriota bacterium]
MQGNSLKILFAGGGTGGHLFPGIAIADEIRTARPNAEILFAGTKDRIEARVVPERGYEFMPIWISGFKRKSVLGNILLPLKVMVAVLQSYRMIRKFNPDVVVGTGGYVCGPVVFAASLRGVPTLIQEQNSFPGITTRLLASRVDEVHVTFSATQRYLKRTDNVKVSGNPTRSALGTVTRSESTGYFHLDATLKTLLVFGGSLGASSINSAVERVIDRLKALSLQIIWQTGEADYERLRSHESQQIKIYKFIDRMENAYAACDLALCRAGATTVAELMRAAVPAVLVPYPFAAADHQTENARSLVENGAAVLVKDNQLNALLLPTLSQLLDDPSRLKAMSERAHSLARPDAAATLARAVLRLAKG